MAVTVKKLVDLAAAKVEAVDQAATRIALQLTTVDT